MAATERHEMSQYGYALRRLRGRLVWSALAVAVGTFVLAGCATTADTTLPSYPPSTEHVVALIHGSGDSPSDWPDEMSTTIEATTVAAQVSVVVIDWAEAAAARLLAPGRGLRLGRRLGTELLTRGAPPSRLTVVSHSAGAFVAYGMAQVLSQQDELHIRQVYLDPFLARSPVQWRYGSRRFGEYADSAVAYVNTVDPVPFTDGFPVHTAPVDVTDPEHEDREGHWWPVEVFRREIAESDGGVIVTESR
jgi:acetyl esterase/lipase